MGGGVRKWGGGGVGAWWMHSSPLSYNNPFQAPNFPSPVAPPLPPLLSHSYLSSQTQGTSYVADRINTPTSNLEGPTTTPSRPPTSPSRLRPPPPTHSPPGSIARRKHGLSKEQFPVSVYVGSSKNLKDLKDSPPGSIAITKQEQEGGRASRIGPPEGRV